VDLVMVVGLMMMVDLTLVVVVSDTST